MRKRFKSILKAPRKPKKGRAGRRIRIRPKRARIIGVFSCKGGVGKTTTAVNLATFLNKKLGKNVIVVEANLTAPNVGIHLGIVDSSITMHDVLAGRTSIERAVSVSEGGLQFIPGSIAVSEEIHLVDLKSCLEPLRKKYKYIILDSAPGLAPEVIAAVKASDELLVVTNPEVPTIATTLRTFRAAERYKTPITGVVVNMVRGKRYEVPISKIRKTLSWPVAAIVPDDDKVRESMTVGTPVLRHAPRSPAAKKFKELGKRLLAKWIGRRKRP
jgi:septum site-determining protein MinD